MLFAKALSYPLPLAIRLVLDSNSYRNPLPNWFDTISLDYQSKTKHLQDQLAQVRSGQWNMPVSDSIRVPKKSGGANRWLVLSTNQQILLQALTSLIAEDVYHSLPYPARVFSYRLNQDPSRLRFVEEQLPAWFTFQATTREMVRQSGFLLQIDIERVFDRIPRTTFVQWLARHCRMRDAVDLLDQFIDHLDKGGPGIPFLGECVFFLGNAYLSVIDQIVTRYTTRFIRFVDDYRIFATGSEELEGVFERLNRDLRGLGLSINDRKVMLTSADEFEEIVCQQRPQSIQTSYVADEATHTEDKPFELACWLDRVVSTPERYLNDGFGRFLLGRLRQYQFEALVASQRGVETRLDRLASELDARPGLGDRVATLLDKYSSEGVQDENWRLVWLAHLLQFAPTWKRPTQRLERLALNPASSEYVRLWARKVTSERQISPPSDSSALEALHDAPYLQQGRLLYGG